MPNLNWELSLAETWYLKRASKLEQYMRHASEHLPLWTMDENCYILPGFSIFEHILLKKMYRKTKWQFPRSVNIVGKWYTPFWIAPSNCTNIQKNFLEKVDHRGRYSSIFKMGTALGKRGVATSILRPHPCHPYHFWSRDMLIIPWKSQLDSFIGSLDI